MATHRVISADSHVSEPPDLWLDYIDPKFKKRAPHLERRDDGDFFIIEGLPPRSLSGQNVAGQDPKNFKAQCRFEEGRRGGWDPKARVQDQEADGVMAEALYPTIAFSVFRIPDLDYRVACMDAYNRWMADFCAGAPGRLMGLGLITLHDTSVALRQLNDVRRLGLSGACITAMAPQDKPFFHGDYHPFWAAAQEAGLPLSLHVFTESSAVQESPDFLVRYTVVPSRIQQTVSTFIAYGVLEQFPRLKLVSVEVDIGWIPTYLQRLDHAFERHRFRTGTGAKLTMRPSDYFYRQVHATFMEDRAGVVFRHECGINNILWSSDYPHSDGTWPHSQRVIERQMEGVPAEERQKIVCENVQRLYGLR